MTTYELIASLLGGATLLGGAGAVTWHAAKFVYRARETEKKYEAEKNTRYQDQNRIDDLIREIQSMKSVFVSNGLLFFVHDDPPRYPLCPACYSKGKSIRMIRNNVIIHPGVVKQVNLAKSLGIALDIKRVGSFLPKGFICVECSKQLLLDVDGIESIKEQGHYIPD